jgi:dTDP-4-amino-4,6-dideoxygalactose transaminase
MISSYRPYFGWRELLAVLKPDAGRSEFEAAVARRVGARYGLAFAYGRSAVIAVFKTLGLSQAEVIIPAYTCAVMAEAIVASGNKPVFVDIDLADYNMDVNALKAALTPQTRAIIVTHMFGYPADVNAVRRIVGDERMLILEDAALALRPFATGTISPAGDAALYSFGPGKQLYTINGGVIVTNSAGLYEQVKAYRDREMSRLPNSVWARRCAQMLTAYMALSGSLEERLLKLKNVGPVKQVREATGLTRVALPQDYAAAYANFQARVGLAQLQKLDVVLARTQAIAEFYHQQLQGVPGLSLAPVRPNSTYTYYSVRVERRDEIEFQQRMLDRGIEVGLNFNYALPQRQVYQPYARHHRYPMAEQAAREVVNLPSYAGLRWSEAQRIVDCVRYTLGQSCVQTQLSY